MVTFHQDIYGSGVDHSDSDGMVLRTQLTPMFDKYDIDVVLQGHDHTYSRTYQLTGDGEEHNEYDNNLIKSRWIMMKTFQAENHCYEIKSDVKGGTIDKSGRNRLLRSKLCNRFQILQSDSVLKQNYIAERSQTWTPTYSVVSVTDDTFSVTTYDATTQEPVEGSSTYTIKKTDDSEDQGQIRTRASRIRISQNQQTPVPTAASDNNNTNTQAPVATTTATAPVRK